MTELIHFALIGCGHIGKRHIEMIQRHPEAQLVAVCDILPKENLGLSDLETTFFDSAEKMLAADIQIDVVCIATPNGWHETHALMALQAGKHLLIEKPMALSKASCERILFSALEKGKQVFCVMQNRYSPPSVWLKDVLKKGLLGEIFMVQVNCFWNRDHRYYKPDSWHGTKNLDGGTLFTQFSHFIDMLYWLFGDISAIQGKAFNFSHKESIDFEDSAHFSFQFHKGGTGTFHYSTSVWDKNMESSLAVIAENGALKIGGQYMNEVVYCHIKDYEMPILPAANPANDYGGYKGSAANHGYVFENVIDTLKGRASIAVNALEGMKVVEMIERMYEVVNTH